MNRSPEPSSRVVAPRTVDLACAAVGLTVLFVAAHVVLSRGYTAQLGHLLEHINANAKKPEHPFDTAARVADFRRSILVQGLVVIAVLSLLAAGLRRVRFANGARWSLIVVLLVLGLMTGWLVVGPLALVPISGYPLALQIARSASGAGSTAVLALLLVPQSRRYFHECRALTHPGAPERPGLAGLFGPRRPPAGAAGSTAGPTADSTASPPARDRARDRGRTRSASDNPARGRVKAKVRVDSEAVAKGAELARARAKASKPRRTE